MEKPATDPSQTTAMLNNSTYPLPGISFSLCLVDGIARNQSSAYKATALSTSVVIAVLSPVAVGGNALVLAAIWRTASLRTPSYVLLCGLAFTDLCTGLITQPLYVASLLICLEEGNESNQISLLVDATAVCGTFFTTLTLILIAVISIERWLHMTRRSLLTMRRSCIIVAVASVVLIPVTVGRISWPSLAFSVIFFTCLLVSLTCTSISYFKVFQIIRRHQQQVQANESSQNFGQPSIDLAKYKKSVFTILYILGIFYVIFLPFLVITGLFIVNSNTGFEVVFMMSALVLFISSSLNPVIYIWRMNDIRNGVKELLRKCICME